MDAIGLLHEWAEVERGERPRRHFRTTASFNGDPDLGVRAIVTRRRGPDLGDLGVGDPASPLASQTAAYLTGTLGPAHVRAERSTSGARPGFTTPRARTEGALGR